MGEANMTAVGLRAVLVVPLLAGSSAASAQEAAPRTEGESPPFELIDSPRSADTRALTTQFEEIFAVVTERLGVSLDYRIKVSFGLPNPGPCRSRGATMTPPPGSGDDSPPLIFIFADANTDRKQILAALAHELGHALQYSAVDGGRALASIFLEGFATWAAEPYWLEWQGAPSFESLIASYIRAGNYLPLHENDGFLDTLSPEAAARFGDDCLRQRDIIYTEWAAFIDYLVEQYGRERLYSLFRTPPLASDEHVELRLPNFPAVYGSSLERLEAAWLETITAAD
jgi:hypothetical protein